MSFEKPAYWENHMEIAKESYLMRKTDIMFPLAGKWAAVTGGKNGLLGPIWSQTLKDAGATVWEFDLPGFDVTQDSISSAGTWTKYIDILVNNAGIDNPPGSEASFFGNFSRIMEVNLTGAVKMCEQVIPGMLEKGGGVIINIGSVMGSVGADPYVYPHGFQKPVAYNCSKAALAQLSRSITTQYGRFGIRAVTLSFGGVDSPGWSDEFRQKYLSKIPLGRPVSEKSLRAALLFTCCCPELAGSEIIVDGGYTSW